MESIHKAPITTKMMIRFLSRRNWYKCRRAMMRKMIRETMAAARDGT